MDSSARKQPFRLQSAGKPVAMTVTPKKVVKLKVGSPVSQKDPLVQTWKLSSRQKTSEIAASKYSSTPQRNSSNFSSPGQTQNQSHVQKTTVTPAPNRQLHNFEVRKSARTAIKKDKELNVARTMHKTDSRQSQNTAFKGSNISRDISHSKPIKGEKLNVPTTVKSKMAVVEGHAHSEPDGEEPDKNVKRGLKSHEDLPSDYTDSTDSTEKLNDGKDKAIAEKDQNEPAGILHKFGETIVGVIHKVFDLEHLQTLKEQIVEHSKKFADDIDEGVDEMVDFVGQIAPDANRDDLKKAEQALFTDIPGAKFEDIEVEKDVTIHTIIFDPKRNPRVTKIPLVMIHGFGGGLACFLRSYTDLCEERTVYGIDLPGFALSTRVPFPRVPLDCQNRMISLLDKWREKIKIDKFILLGHSFGGYLSAAYTVRYHTHVRHLILEDPWGICPKEEDPLKEDPRLWVEALMTISEMLKAKPFELVRSFGSLGKEVYENLKTTDDDKKWSDYYYSAMAQRPATGELAFSVLSGYEYLWAEAPMKDHLIELPTSVAVTFMYGAESRFYNKCAETIKEKRCKNTCVLEPFKGIGHEIHSKDPCLFNREVKKILADVDRENEEETSQRAAMDAASVSVDLEDGKAFNGEVRKYLVDADEEYDGENRQGPVTNADGMRVLEDTKAETVKQTKPGHPHNKSRYSNVNKDTVSIYLQPIKGIRPPETKQPVANAVLQKREGKGKLNKATVAIYSKPIKRKKSAMPILQNNMEAKQVTKHTSSVPESSGPDGNVDVDITFYEDLQPHNTCSNAAIGTSPPSQPAEYN